jgi:hypothetical protein
MAARMSDTLRRFLLVIFILGAAGVTAELLLLAHVEDFDQLIPIGLCGLGLIAAVVVAIKPAATTVRAFRALMVLFIASGALGSALHFKANLEFQREVDPSLRGRALFQKAIRAKSPPALAPGAMIQLGLIGLAYTFRGLPPTDNRRGV